MAQYPVDRFVVSTLRPRARAMRFAPTRSEALLWERLRRGQLGVHFRRQEPIGPYIVDFCARRERLVVEVDGESHEGRAGYDVERDTELRAMGWRVLRLDAAVVERDVREAAAIVWRELGR